MRTHRPVRYAIFALACALAAAGSGCGKSAPTVPSAQETFTLASYPLPIVHGPATVVANLRATVASDSGGPSAGCPADSLQPHVALQGMAQPDRETRLSGCRYDLVIPAGAVAQATPIELKYWSADWVEVRLDATGELLGPITLAVDLGGTNVDSTSANYDGSTPRAFAYDATIDRWVRQPASFERSTNRMTVTSQRLGRVAVGSKAGW